MNDLYELFFHLVCEIIEHENTTLLNSQCYNCNVVIVEKNVTELVDNDSIQPDILIICPYTQ